MQIEVGQQWVTRDGHVVRITADRGADAAGGWRWACSNSEIVHEPDGRAAVDAAQAHPHDLMQRHLGEAPITDSAILGALGLPG